MQESSPKEAKRISGNFSKCTPSFYKSSPEDMPGERKGVREGKRERETSTPCPLCAP